MHSKLFVVVTIITALFVNAAFADSWRTLSPVAPLPDADTQGFVEANAVNIHYKIFGQQNAKPIVLLHGGLGAIEDFGSQVEALSVAHKVIAIDSRGHGRSSLGVQPITTQDMALDVVAVMDALKVEAATIVGWSDGGVIGLELAINFPDRVSGLFLIGTYYSIKGSRPPSANDEIAAAYMLYAEKQYRAISPTPDSYSAFSSKVFGMWSREPDYPKRKIKRIKVPAVVAVGRYEEFIDETHARRMAKLMPGAEFWLIENASHFPMWQQPEAINKAILDFMERVQ